MTTETTTTKPPWRDPTMTKLAFGAILLLLLLIPLSWVDDLVRERQNRFEEVRSELAGSWGGDQLFQGPVMTVPYLTHFRDDKGVDHPTRRLAHFLPETLRIEGALDPEVRSRGIFDLVLYRTSLRVTGSFAKPDFTAWKVSPEDVLWDEATLAVSASDLRGVQQNPRLSWDGLPLVFEPGLDALSRILSSGMSAQVPLLATSTVTVHEFAFDLTLNGSEALRFSPFGKENEVVLTSGWKSPSFEGAFLPVERAVDAEGFTATWKVSYFARSFAQAWQASEVNDQALAAQMAAPAFGVRLLQPIDVYRQTERATKYGLLFLLVTFGTFFLFEAMNPIRVHPVQYVLVGFALCLFYVLVLSISEPLGFGPAYAIATTATVGLIGSYSWKILGGLRRAALLTTILGGLYGYLYVVLQLEDYALLLGTAGLFAILAGVMWVTRNVDWYSLDLGKRAAAMPASVGAAS